MKVTDRRMGRLFPVRPGPPVASRACVTDRRIVRVAARHGQGEVAPDRPPASWRHVRGRRTCRRHDEGIDPRGAVRGGRITPSSRPSVGATSAGLAVGGVAAAPELRAGEDQRHVLVVLVRRAVRGSDPVRKPIRIGDEDDVAGSARVRAQPGRVRHRVGGGFVPAREQVAWCARRGRCRRPARATSGRASHSCWSSAASFAAASFDR